MYIPRPYTPSPEELEQGEGREFRLPRYYSDLLKALGIVERTPVSGQIHGALAAAIIEWEKGETGLYAPQPLKYRESSERLSMIFTLREQQAIADATTYWKTDESALICGAVWGYLRERRADEAVNRYRQSIALAPPQPD